MQKMEKWKCRLGIDSDSIDINDKRWVSWPLSFFFWAQIFHSVSDSCIDFFCMSDLSKYFVLLYLNLLESFLLFNCFCHSLLTGLNYSITSFDGKLSSSLRYLRLFNFDFFFFDDDGSRCDLFNRFLIP